MMLLEKDVIGIECCLIIDYKGELYLQIVFEDEDGKLFDVYYFFE